MSIERAATQGAVGEAARNRKTKEGNLEERSNLEAMAVYYKGRGDNTREGECLRRVEELKRESVYE